MGNEESSNKESLNEEGTDIWGDKFMWNTLDDFLEEAKQSLNYEKIYLLYCLQFKNKFIKWLWKARENIAMRNSHPSKFQELFDRGFDIDEIDVDKFDSYFTQKN
jgi:hypothetical protein